MKLISEKSDTISYCESCFEFNHISIDLSRKPTMSKVFAIFTRQKNHEVNKKHLIDYIYLSGQARNPSRRLQESYSINLVKLLSRARKELSMKITPNHLDEDITWFPYDHAKKCWYLYQRRSQTAQNYPNTWIK